VTESGRRIGGGDKGDPNRKEGIGVTTGSPTTFPGREF